VVQERDQNNTPAVSYTRGNDLGGGLETAGGIGGLLARGSSYSGGNWNFHAYYHSDGGGNITFVVDGNQGTLASYKYDSFGNILSKSGSLADVNLYRFSSKEFHVNSGLYYYLYRFYDTGLQRWLNRDPFEEGGGVNLYGFVRNNPMNLLDRLGLCGGEEDAAAEEDFFERFKDELELEREGRYIDPPGGTFICRIPEQPTFEEILDSIERDPFFQTFDKEGQIRGPHGNADHWRAIRDEVERMEKARYTDIRVNNAQRDAKGNIVGRNRPDVSGVNPKTGQRENVEFDRSPSRSLQHFRALNQNDSKAKNDCRLLP
jgi:RHS repeat-associated protein